jgi:hypothetical protein
MATIKVPKTPARAFDPDRRPSKLLLDQIRHLEWAALPAAERKPHRRRPRTVATEGQAAARVKQLTELVLEASKTAQAEGKPGVAVATTLPPLPRGDTGGPQRAAPPQAPASRRHRSKSRTSRTTKGRRRRRSS